MQQAFLQGCFAQTPQVTIAKDQAAQALQARRDKQGCRHTPLHLGHKSPSPCRERVCFKKGSERVTLRNDSVSFEEQAGSLRVSVATTLSMREREREREERERHSCCNRSLRVRTGLWSPVRGA